MYLQPTNIKFHFQRAQLATVENFKRMLYMKVALKELFLKYSEHW